MQRAGRVGTDRRKPIRRGEPSGWAHRLPVAVLALIGCGLATYLTLYQWHATGSVWDPIFGTRSSEQVLTSVISRYLPVPDATLGAVAYLVEAVLTVVGGRRRWLNSPWVVVLFGLTVAGMAIISLGLTLTQVLLVHAFCTLCLASAGISFVNAGLAGDEILATADHLRRGHAEDRSLWPLLLGRPREASAAQHRSPARSTEERTRAENAGEQRRNRI